MAVAVAMVGGVEFAPLARAAQEGGFTTAKCPKFPFFGLEKCPRQPVHPHRARSANPLLFP
jgi:hypothetical protein